jgi:hypothetical protein
VAAKVFAIDGVLVITHLPDELIASIEGNPSKQRIGLHLHAPLPFDHSASL